MGGIRPARGPERRGHIPIPDPHARDLGGIAGLATMRQLIGVDLGTTFSVVARVTARGKPKIVPNRDGRRKTRSVVSFDGAAPVVGATGDWSTGVAPSVARFAKCAFGDPTWRFHTADGRRFRSEEICAIILRRLKEDAETAVGGEVTDAVLTVPACFDDAARRATVDAGRIAGLRVCRVLNEPTAAALAYASDVCPGDTVLVYALGGGAFDATVLRAGEGGFDVLATRGDRTLGGLDWDNVLVRLLNRRFQAAGGPDLLDDSATEADLRDKAESAKHLLTTLAQARTALSAGGVSRTVSVSRVEFEEATAALLGRTRDLAAAAAQDAGLSWPQVDRLVLAGGATRMPMVRAMLRGVYGKAAGRSINPDEVVALGAAVQAQLDAAPAGGPRPGPHDGGPLTVREVASHGLGALARDTDTGFLRNVVVIPANTALPATRRSVFATIEESQTRIDVEVTQGDDTNPAAVRRLGRQTVTLPAHPAGAPIEIVYAYTADQVPHLEVNDLTTGQPLGRFAVRNLAAMSDAEVAESAGRIGALALD